MQRPLLLLLVALPLSAALSQDATDRVNHRSMEAFTLEDNLRQLRDEVGGGAKVRQQRKKPWKWGLDAFKKALMSS